MTPNLNPLMLIETRESPQVVARLLDRNAERVLRIADAIRERKPIFAVTVARGTSHHAATLVKYALETELGLVTAAAAPSTVTTYGATLRLAQALVFGISQSGQSPDVVETLRAARACGALTVAIVNDESSPLAQAAEFVLPMHAGPERAVAATKTFLASLAAPLQIIAEVAGDEMLKAALASLPQALRETLELSEEVRERAERYRYAEVMLTLARGAHQPVALELALKLKETCTVTAEAFSTAEFAHGPVILVQPGTPVLALHARDASGAGTKVFYQELAARGAELILIGNPDDEIPAETRLATPATGHFLTDPATCAIAGYLFAGYLSLARGMNPDAPRTLTKVTRTL